MCDAFPKGGGRLGSSLQLLPSELRDSRQAITTAKGRKQKYELALTDAVIRGVGYLRREES